VYLALQKLKSIPRNPPDEMNKSFLVNFVEGRDGIIVVDGSEDSLFMLAVTESRGRETRDERTSEPVNERTRERVRSG
jgi:hypothetical protein